MSSLAHLKSRINLKSKINRKHLLSLCNVSLSNVALNKVSLNKVYLKKVSSNNVTLNTLLNSAKIWLIFSAALTIVSTGCTPKPPDYRAQVTAPVYENGDAQRGKILYQDNCEQCHTLKPGSNKKGPQLVGVYMAPSADLEDYNYSEGLESAHWVWDSKTLDKYIADPEVVLPNTRMLSDPMPNAQDRQDIIAYLSTLGRDAPPPLPNSEK